MVQQQLKYLIILFINTHVIQQVPSILKDNILICQFFEMI